MSDSKIAPLRPSVAKFLKRKIGGFVREYEREVNRGSEPPKQPAPEKRAETSLADTPEDHHQET